MQTIYVDFETYYDKEYSLSKMQTDAYIRDARFEVLGVGVAVDDEEIQWFSGTREQTLDYLRQYDWSNAAVCCHHTLFDGFILRQIFGIRPKLWMDTLSCSRMLYSHLKSNSLGAMAKELGLPSKGNISLANAPGTTLSGVTPAMAEYCKQDVFLCRELLRAMLPRMQPIDIRLIDITVRMFVEPQFVGDVPMLEQLHAVEITRKQELLDAANADRSTIMSNAKLAAALESLGVTVPLKISPSSGNAIPAFAKTDKGFTALLEHDDFAVQALVAARLGVKTTIAETRALKMLETARRGPMPVYLNFWGARATGRYSGGNAINWQNLPVRGISAGIRYAIKAPPGKKVVVGDSSNIELRVVMVGAAQLDVVSKLSAGIDLYCDFASKIYGRVTTKNDVTERFLGKVAMLSLQYGAGWEKFKEMVRIQSGIILTDPAAQRIVALYRGVHGEVMNMHRWCGEQILGEIAAGCRTILPVDKRAWCLTTGEGFGVHGAPGVRYHKLHWNKGDNSWQYLRGAESVKIYGGKVVENWGQYVAGRIVLWQTARINERYPVALSVHDEVVCVVDEQDVDSAVSYMRECLTMAPPWCTNQIPLACEIGVGGSYGDAK